jgi:NADH-quinone oxidoreductase subunit I
MEEPPHPRRLGADEKDYFLGLPATGEPDNRTPIVDDAAGGTR